MTHVPDAPGTPAVAVSAVLADGRTVPRRATDGVAGASYQNFLAVAGTFRRVAGHRGFSTSDKIGVTEEGQT